MNDTAPIKLGDSQRPLKLPEMTPAFEFAFQSRVITEPTRSLGNLHGSGERRVVVVAGGDFSGPKLRGRILPGGNEWPLVRPDGVDSIDARYTLETDDGVLINLRNTGYRVIAPELKSKLRTEVVDASKYYFRTSAIFEAPVGKYDWLTRNVFFGLGERHPDVLYVWYYRLL